MPAQPIYQFYAELRDYKPKMWRRLQIVGNVSLARLGYALMTVFEMQASHLFAFEVPLGENLRVKLRERLAASYSREEIEKRLAELVPIRQGATRYELSAPEIALFGDDEASEDAAKAHVSSLFDCPGQTATFFYDFGDGWEIALTLEEIVSDKELPARELPRLLDGAGYGIIEDCGGPGGLADVRDAYRKKKGEAYRDYCEWLGRDTFDLDAMDLDDLNFRLKKLPRIFMQIYEERLEPTERSLKLLNRDYMR